MNPHPQLTQSLALVANLLCRPRFIVFLLSFVPILPLCDIRSVARAFSENRFCLGLYRVTLPRLS